VNVLITGAAGFIGSKLVKHLMQFSSSLLSQHRYQVLALDIARMDHLGLPSENEIYCDITLDDHMTKLAEVMKERKVTACIHLAAIAAPRMAAADPMNAWNTNVRGTHNVLTLMRLASIRKVVFASSAHVYGISPRYMPTDENHPLALQDTYTTTKIMGEQLCQLYHSNYGLSPTILRLFNAYGPGQSADYFIGVKLGQAQRGEPISLMNADVTKDWVYIDDVIDAFERALHTEFVGPINIGTGVETSLRQIAARIAGAYDVPVIPDPHLDTGPTRMCCDDRRASSILTWKAMTTIEQGIANLIETSKKEEKR